MHMVTIIKVNGKMIKLKELECSNLLMDPFLKDNGTMTKNGELALNNGLTAASMKVLTMKVIKQDLEDIHGPMETHT